MTTVTLTWPLKTWPNPNRDRRKHWTKQREEGRNIRAAACVAATKAMGAPFTAPVALTLAWAFPDKRSRDLENYSSKALVDGITDSGLIADDDARHIVSVTKLIDPERTPTGMLKVTATFEIARP